MTIEAILAELASSNYLISYLRQRDIPGTQYSWEALIRQALLQPTNGYRYITGFGCGYTAADALDDALDAILRDPRFPEPVETNQSYTYQPASNPLATLLSNLRKPVPPAFNRRL